MFWEIFLNLCKQINKTPNGVAKEIPVSSGAITSWKNGKVPHHSTLIKIANYFNVSLDYLLTGKEKASTETTDERVTMEEYRLVLAYRAQPELQKAVNKLLGIQDSDIKSVPFKGRLVAMGGKNLGDNEEDDEPRHT